MRGDKQAINVATDSTMPLIDCIIFFPGPLCPRDFAWLVDECVGVMKNSVNTPQVSGTNCEGNAGTRTMNVNAIPNRAVRNTVAAF